MEIQTSRPDIVFLGLKRMFETWFYREKLFRYGMIGNDESSCLFAAYRTYFENKRWRSCYSAGKSDQIGPIRIGSGGSAYFVRHTEYRPLVLIKTFCIVEDCRLSSPLSISRQDNRDYTARFWISKRKSTSPYGWILCLSCLMSSGKHGPTDKMQHSIALNVQGFQRPSGPPLILI